MKKIIIATIATLMSTHLWAIDEQITYAAQYTDRVQNTINQLSEEDLKNLPQYFQTKRDLHVNKKYNEIKMLQKQWGVEEDGIYSPEIQKFVKHAQEEKGLNPTGIIDLNTWFILYEQPVSWRMEETKRAFDQWVAIKERDLSKNNSKMVVINIPSMMLHVYDKSPEGVYTKAFSMKVVIGSRKHKTPTKDLNILSLKYNPTWTPTNNIVARSAFDKEGNVNETWLKNNNITIYGPDKEIIPYEELPYYDFRELKFIQPPGDDNSLGLLKFETNSKENIYLHDTNARRHFGFNVRTYSSGCIRVEDYSKLAAYLLNKDEQHIVNQIDKNDTFWERVKTTPVYFDTSRVQFDNDGNPQFFHNIY